MPTLNVSVSEEMQAFVDGLVSEGRFRSRNAVFEEALHLLGHVDCEAMLDWLRRRFASEGEDVETLDGDRFFAELMSSLDEAR